MANEPAPTGDLTTVLFSGVMVQAVAGVAYGVAEAEEIDPLRYVALVGLIIGGLLTFVGAMGWAVYLALQAHAKSRR